MIRTLLPLFGVFVLLASPLVAQEEAVARYADDLEAMEQYRPGYAFWQHIFTVADGAIAFGSARDGRLLATFPSRGDWVRQAVWSDRTLAATLEGQPLPARLDDRRDFVARLLEEAIGGPVVHNPTRGRFLAPNATRYGGMLRDWGAIYERFAVPAEVGLAQALIESGLNGTRRSEARAVGFCQWLESNWKRLNRLSPHPIESGNQTTQAAYCAAHLTILATKYGSFIPALSVHHSGGTNVGRVLINGARLGAVDVRDQYFAGAQLARDLRQIDLYGFRDLYRTYGPRSYAYAEMVFGNTYNVRRLVASMPQVKVYAMRVPKALPLTEITRRTRLSADEVRRFNPALTRQVPARATLYLPMPVKEFGADVSFWHRPPAASFATVLAEFLRLEASPEVWDEPSFEPILRRFEQRFRATKTEEGTVMATMLAFVIDDARTGGRREILAEFRRSSAVMTLLAQAVGARDARQGPATLAACSDDPTAAVQLVRTTC